MCVCVCVCVNGERGRVVISINVQCASKVKHRGKVSQKCIVYCIYCIHLSLSIVLSNHSPGHATNVHIDAAQCTISQHEC